MRESDGLKPVKLYSLIVSLFLCNIVCIKLLRDQSFSFEPDLLLKTKYEYINKIYNIEMQIKYLKNIKLH